MDEFSSFSSDYPILCRQRSPKEIVMTDLSDADESHICLDLEHYNFKNFLT